MGDGTLEGDTVQCGLFWEREHAILFAERLRHQMAIKELQRVIACADSFLETAELDDGYFSKEYDVALSLLRQAVFGVKENQ